MTRQLCFRGMSINLLRSHGQQLNYSKAKFPSKLNCETGPWWSLSPQNCCPVISLKSLKHNLTSVRYLQATNFQVSFTVLPRSKYIATMVVPIGVSPDFFSFLKAGNSCPTNFKHRNFRTFFGSDWTLLEAWKSFAAPSIGLIMAGLQGFVNLPRYFIFNIFRF